MEDYHRFDMLTRLNLPDRKVVLFRFCFLTLKRLYQFSQVIEYD